jgi:hypothetical protein
MTKKCCYNNNFNEFIGEEMMRTRDDKRMVKIDFFSKLPFLEHILKKITHSHFGAWSFLLIHIWFTHGEGPKGFVNCFL